MREKAKTSQSMSEKRGEKDDSSVLQNFAAPEHKIKDVLIYLEIAEKKEEGGDARLDPPP